MANEVDNSKELNEIKNKITGAEIQKEFMLTTLKSLTLLLKDVMFLRNDVAILRMKMKYITFSIICMAVSSIF